MKKINLILVIIVFSIITAAFISEKDLSQASVEQRQGMYVYIGCKPIKFEYLGTVKSLAGVGIDGLANKTIKKAKEEYPKANAVIFNSFEVDKADAVKIDSVTAKSEQRQGVFVFMCCKPKVEYEYLGTVKNKTLFPGSIDNIALTTIKKCKEQYPTCDAVIFNGFAFNTADAVKFKN